MLAKLVVEEFSSVRWLAAKVILARPESRIFGTQGTKYLSGVTATMTPREPQSKAVNIKASKEQQPHQPNSDQTFSGLVLEQCSSEIFVNTELRIRSVKKAKKRKKQVNQTEFRVHHLPDQTGGFWLLKQTSSSTNLFFSTIDSDLLDFESE